MANGVNLGPGNPNVPLGGDISRSAIIAQLLKQPQRKAPLLSPGATIADIGTSGLKALSLAMLRQQGLESDEAASKNFSEAFADIETPGAPFQGPIDNPNRFLNIQDKRFAGDLPSGEFGGQGEREAMAVALNKDTGASLASLQPDPTGDRFGFPPPPPDRRQPTDQEIAQVLLQNPQNRQLGGQFLLQGRQEGQAADLRAQDLATKQQAVQQSQEFTAGQNELNRQATLDAAGAKRNFKAGESQLDRLSREGIAKVKQQKVSRKTRTVQQGGKFFEITEDVSPTGFSKEVSRREVFPQFRTGFGVDPSSGETKAGVFDLSKIDSGEGAFKGLAERPAPTAGKLTESQKIAEEEKGGKLQEALDTIDRIEKNLATNPFVAGGTGALQRLGELPKKFAGQSRGIPATEFQKDIEFLALEIAPALTGEKRISLEERAEIKRLIGGLGTLTTKGDVLSVMRKLKTILGKRKDIKPSSKQDNQKKLEEIFGAQ